MSTTTEVDVLIVSDLRLPGGTMASIAEEVRAQAAPGDRTGLIHVNSRLSRKRDLGIDARLGRCIDEGMATLVLRGNMFARLAVLRNGTVFERKPEPVVHAEVSAVALIANNVAVDAGGTVHFDLGAVNTTVTEAFGVRPLWVSDRACCSAHSPTTRDAIDLAHSDWANLIDVDEWSVDRSAGVRGSAVIGRHSRPQGSKWPERPSDLIAAYPETGEFLVRILGGADAVRDVLGRSRGRGR